MVVYFSAPNKSTCHVHIDHISRIHIHIHHTIIINGHTDKDGASYQINDTAQIL